MQPLALRIATNNVREQHPLIHCITNYVTVNDCANVLLACGGSPIMSDEPDDVEEITSICGGLVINIGTLNKQSIRAMEIAGAQAAKLGHPIVLDPVGAGASRLRTTTAGNLTDTLPISVIRGNMSEIKALAGASANTRGVDVNPDDVITEQNYVANAAFARDLAAKLNTIIAITGAIDIVADETQAFAIRNGTPFMGTITGTGCMLSCLLAAYLVANAETPVDATVAAIASMGLAGQLAARRMGADAGNGSFRIYLLDALCAMDGALLEEGALIEVID